jgi:hypothetical protein
MNDSKEGSKLLHRPSRAHNLSDLDDHLNTAARLSRALWNALNNPNIDTSDERDREALAELASIIADHTSAAEFAYNNKARTKQREPDGGV